MCVIVGICYVAYIDIEKKLSQTAKDVAIDIERCKSEYISSNCDPNLRVPAAQDYCIEREKCMKQDPLEVAQKTHLGARLIAEVINNLTEPLTYRSFAFVCVLVIG